MKAKKKTKPKAVKRTTKPKELTFKHFLDIPTGTMFTATIEGVETQGLIYNNRKEQIFFCQNKKRGSESPHKLGFQYSWVVSEFKTLEGNGVLNAKFYRKPKNFKVPKLPKEPVSLQITASYKAEINFEGIRVGCQHISFEKFDELARIVKKVRKL